MDRPIPPDEALRMFGPVRIGKHEIRRDHLEILQAALMPDLESALMPSSSESEVWLPAEGYFVPLNWPEDLIAIYPLIYWSFRLHGQERVFTELMLYKASLYGPMIKDIRRGEKWAYHALQVLWKLHRSSPRSTQLPPELLRFADEELDRIHAIVVGGYNLIKTGAPTEGDVDIRIWYVHRQLQAYGFGDSEAKKCVAAWLNASDSNKNQTDRVSNALRNIRREYTVAIATWGLSDDAKDDNSSTWHLPPPD